MDTPVHVSPEELVELRESVKLWQERAQGSLIGFARQDGSFLLDSNHISQDGKYRLHPTATARSYLGLAAADRWTRNGSLVPPEWVNKFHHLCNSGKLFNITGREDLRSRDGKHRTLNNFDIAHLSDYVLVNKYIDRFYLQGRKERVDLSTIFQPRRTWKKKLCDLLNDNLESCAQNERQGAVLLEEESGDNSKRAVGHYFVTLHTLRSFSQLDAEPNKKHVEKIVKYAEQFCITQAFYSTRSGRHQFDIVSLVFALVIYTFYSRQVDKDLCDACIGAVANSQQSNGSWPATHPIIRSDRRPWHITSHELALCLTWLYFQPRVPDSGRDTLLSIMEKHFRRWVVRTFTSTGKAQKESPGQYLSGWFDDHTIEPDLVMGWATAIVCHFLSNYYQVLSDNINRRVIEATNLTASSKYYLIDEDANRRSPRWTASVSEPPWKNQEITVWPDLPPVSWLWDWEPEKFLLWLRRNWTDPSCEDGEKSISEILVDKLVVPIFDSPSLRPSQGAVSFVLPGAPGTRKTTLVNKLARLLRWPIVMVPPSVIFDSGFDSLEARADELFRRLTYLSGCVVFFDEFEEFIRDRSGQEGTIHDRTIAAFMTSSMLPRFQQLNDQGKNVIFLATNHIDRIDEAILRPGRFDYTIEMKHPRRERIEEYLGGDLTTRTEKTLGVAVATEVPGGHDSHLWPTRPLDEVKAAVLEAVKEVFAEGEEVRFVWVEGALRAVARGDPADQNLRETARQSLQRGRMSATNAKPPMLWER